MCQLEKYIENEKGYVAKCSHSEVLQILYGNILMSVNKNNFFKVAEIIQKSKKRHEHLTNLKQKVVVMNTQASGLYISMDIAELNQFHDMLEQTKFLMEVENITFNKTNT